jgi:hypothetical protein
MRIYAFDAKEERVLCGGRQNSLEFGEYCRGTGPVSTGLDNQISAAVFPSPWLDPRSSVSQTLGRLHSQPFGTNSAAGTKSTPPQILATPARAISASVAGLMTVRFTAATKPHLWQPMSDHGVLRQSSIAQRASSLWSDPLTIGEALLHIAAGPRPLLETLISVQLAVESCGLPRSSAGPAVASDVIDRETGQCSLKDRPDYMICSTSFGNSNTGRWF